MQAHHHGRRRLAHGVEGGGGVDEHRQAALVAEGRPCLDVGRTPERRDRNHRADLSRRCRQGAQDRLGVQHPRRGVDVGEPRDQSCRDHRMGRRGEGEGGQDAELVDADLQGLQPQGQRLGGVDRRRNGRLAVEAGGQAGFELPQQGAEVGVPAGLIHAPQVGQKLIRTRKPRARDGNAANAGVRPQIGGFAESRHGRVP